MPDRPVPHSSPHPRGSHALGRAGEEAAAQMLQRAGWTVLGRNVRDGPRELDLIVRLGSVVAFVEVKTRASAAGTPLEAINWMKRRHLTRAAGAWVRAHGRAGDTYRFDVVSVVGLVPGSAQVEWLRDAWRIGD